MIKLTVEKEVTDYIKYNRYEGITMEIMTFGGCGGEHYEPMVRAGRPLDDEADKFDVAEIDGIKVWYMKAAETRPEGARIFMQKDKYMPELAVEGLDYPASSLDYKMDY